VRTVPDPTPTRAPGWLTAADRARGGLAADLGLYLISAGFAGLTAATASLPPHGAWGRLAVLGYAAASLLAAGQLATRRRWTRLAGSPARAGLTGLAWAATCLLPLLVEAAQRAAGRTDRAQEEVVVVEHGADRLLHSGTPYLGRAAIAALPAGDRLIGYLPYQPGMALFGMPRVLAGTHWWSDARVWFAVATAAALGGALLILHRAAVPAPALIRAAQAATVVPVCALALAVGGDDLPVLALCLLALAWAATGRFGWAGVAVGAAGALKLFAWPVALVLLALAVRRGRGARFAPGALGLPVLALLPAVLVDPGAAAENVLRFPAGRGLVSSPAQSPFPGQLIAAGLPGGRFAAAALLGAAGLVFAGWLLRRPPRDARAAALVCATGLLTATLLLPATRFGYLLYPIGYAVWAPALRLDS
jgi:Glycosyltransferase family 87